MRLNNASGSLALSARVATVLAILVALVGVMLVATPGKAEAVTAKCASGRCTIYLSKAETKAFSQGAVPAPPSFVPAPIRTAYYALVLVHRWIAGQYASRGWCSAFRLSIYPWETQGYYGYRC